MNFAELRTCSTRSQASNQQQRLQPEAVRLRDEALAVALVRLSLPRDKRVGAWLPDVPSTQGWTGVSSARSSSSLGRALLRTPQLFRSKGRGRVREEQQQSGRSRFCARLAHAYIRKTMNPGPQRRMLLGPQLPAFKAFGLVKDSDSECQSLADRRECSKGFVFNSTSPFDHTQRAGRL